MGNKPPTKLHTFWKGPMRVVSNNGTEYKVHDLVRNHTISVHVSRLKAFEHDAARVDPLHIASQWSSDMLQTQRKLIALAQKRQKEKDDAHIAKSKQ